MNMAGHCFIISNMKKIFTLGLMVVLTSCTGVVFQPSHRFYVSPEKTVQQTPDSVMIPVSKNVSLHAWHFHTKEKNIKGVIVQFHGNAENISSHYLSVAWMLNYGYDLVTFDYRGYGLSEGISSFPEVVVDSEKVLEFVRDQYKGQVPIIVYGQSIGSIIAENAVKRSKVPISQMVLEGGIYSLNQVSANILSKHWVTWLFQPFGYVLMTHHYNFKKIAKDFPKIPVLLLHSRNDPIISYKQSEKIYNALPSQKCLKLVEEREHVNIGNVGHGKYRQDILNFLEKSECKNE